MLLVAAPAAIDWNHFRPRIEHAASRHLGRTVSLGGPLQVLLLSRAPTVTVNDLTVGGPPWNPEHDLAKVERLSWKCG
jgi:uncharacterized protein involved in outer membrane biogenesis